MAASTWHFAVIATLTLTLSACEGDDSSSVDTRRAAPQFDGDPQSSASGVDASVTPVPPPVQSPDAGAPDSALAAADSGQAAQVWPDASQDAASDPVDAGTLTCGGRNGLRPGKSSVELTVAGQARSFALYVPSGYTGTTAVPLVIDFHGLHEGAVLHELLSGWDDRAEREGYVLAMPQGIDNAWNVGPCCTASRTVDDVAFARAIVEHVSSAGCIDPQRVYATGYSNGGGMSFKLACEAADVFAAIAPSAFDLLEEMRCAPSRPLSVFIFRGTADLIVPYPGGPSTPPTLYPLPEIHFLGAVKTFERWAELNACTGAPADTGDGCQAYTQCEAGVKVVLCTKQGGGHDPVSPAVAWPMLKEFTKP